MLGKIERVKLSEEIFQRLKDMIKNGQFGYGDKLPGEKRLAEIFGVSRTTVREALAGLEAEGWIITKQGGGTYVRRLHSAAGPIEPLTSLLGGKNVAILELMEVRKILECEVAMLAALRATPEDIIEIKAAYRNMVEAVAQGADTTISDFAFHYAVAKAAKNNTIISIISYLYELYAEVVKNGKYHKSKPAGYKLILTEHEKIVKAIEQRKCHAAHRAMEIHLDRAHRILEEVLVEYYNSNLNP
ncbi:GntR domain protein [Thermosinus carboxydivorans Nor1]|uniref:GntR domain protein n=1 Tax=Thermosinus carboxydivorans Nor1 TaxID=401526 RepID=A1HMI3_9FIRM|nr:FadR/GntR family transcriptional regulator [Thermosinus carboxydivorans]EAX49022.1 GntR domain protein [Thermosinus carboxydivorans Nor1]